MDNSIDVTWDKFWQLLYSDVAGENDYPTARPLLAHYTSLENAEKILTSEELWLSNPLVMNDNEEVRFGVLSGLKIIHASDTLRQSLGTDVRRVTFFEAIEGEYQAYGSEHVLDLYVICFSVHDSSNVDGRLSMWRGYGNQGKGAAIVFDTSKLPVPDASPLVLGAVLYGTQEDRKHLIEKKIDEVANFLKSHSIPDEYIGNVALELFRRLCIFSVFTKHIGFQEENEWRLVYLKDRDQPNEGETDQKYKKILWLFKWSKWNSLEAQTSRRRATSRGCYGDIFL